MQIAPVGHRVLIRPEKVEEVSRGGIVIAKPHVEKEQLAQVCGEVLATGADCWREYESPWCKVGDKVLYQRYAGMRVPDGKGGFRDDMVLLNDLDITGIVLEDVAHD